MKHKMFGIIAGACVLFTASGLIAQEALLEWSTDADDLQNEWKGRIKYETVDNKLCAVVDNNKLIISKFLTPVKAGKNYVLTGMFKSLGKDSSKVYYGFDCYDKDQKRISTYHANLILGSITTLAKDCKEGDTIIVIKANARWKKNYPVAFNAKEDFSDLPNREIVIKVTEVVPEGENMKVTLSKPLKKAYPAGTKVRQHTFSCGSLLYTTICGKEIPMEWKSYTGTAKMAKPGQYAWNLLRPGTAFVKIIVLPNQGKGKDQKLAFTNLTLKETE